MGKLRVWRCPVAGLGQANHQAGPSDSCEGVGVNPLPL